MKFIGETFCYSDDGNTIIKAKVMNIDPDTATALLENNSNNRTLSESVVAKYAADMKAGRWKKNGESICFDEKGNLKNGQHRLHAIIKAQVSLPFIIAVVSSSESEYYDLNRVRNVSHMIQIGHPELPKAFKGTQTSALVRFLHWNSTRKLPTKAEIVELILNNKEDLEWAYVVASGSYKSSIPSPLRRATVIAALLCAYKSGYPYDKLMHFIEVLHTGIIEHSIDSLVIKLRDHLMTSGRLPGGSLNEKSDTYKQFRKVDYILYQYYKGNEKAKIIEGQVQHYNYTLKNAQLSFNDLQEEET